MSERVKSNEEIRARPDELRETLARARAAFEPIDGVLSVGIGQKETGGSYRSDLAIVVIVREKRALNELAAQQRIPPVFEGYRTDVAVLKDGDVVACDNNAEYGIIQGGIQIVPTIKSSDGRFGKGTLGCIVHRRADLSRDNVYLISCKHVLFDRGAGPDDYAYHPFPAHARGAGQTGPSTALGPTQKTAFYENVGYIPPGSTVPSQFFLDCATARINIDCKCWGTRCTKDDIKYDTTIVDLELGTDDPSTPRREDNTIADVRNVIDDVSIVGQPVFKVGRSTGKTVGIVRRINGSTNVLKDFNDDNSGRMPAVNLIQIDYDTTSPDGPVNCVGNQRFVEAGDSGSIVVDAQRRAIGIVAIGAPLSSDQAPPPRAAPAYACHIMPVLDRLGICIATAGGTSRGSSAATDGTGITPVRPTQAELPVPDGQIHLARRAAKAARPDHVEQITITAAENDRMLALRDQLRETAYGIELHETFAEIRREIGYLVRNVRPVKVAWHRQRGPAFFAHVLHHLKGDTDSVPREIDGVSREALLTRMGELLAAHGSHPLRAAIERHGPLLLTILSNADTVHDCLEALRAEVTI
jgi:hypothetical protein